MRKFWNYTKSFGKFWYNFVIGDDWTLAVAAATGIILDIILHFTIELSAWYILPVLVAIALGLSIKRASSR
ncbi:MAG: hypothetical protein ACREGA_03590 [Candidatus Saccharimonadales bacterium]